MPLFGRKNKTDNDAADTTTDNRNQQDMNRSAMSSGMPQDSSQQRAANPNQPGMGGGMQSDMPGSYNQGSNPQSGGAFGNQQIQHPQQQHQHHHGLGGGGTGVGSAALREQGVLKEREASTMHAQSKELGEAEALEQAARDHRERAVAAGADPANRELGGGLHGGRQGGMQGGM